MNQLLQLFYLAYWFVNARIFGRHKPLQSVVFVTGGCDSSCRHCTDCRVSENHMKSYDDIVRDLKACYDKGARILDIEGVNLIDWKDKDKQVGDIFEAARKIGFYNTSTMVPAKFWQRWKEIDAKVDIIWVSISGEKDLPLIDNDRKASLYMVVNANNYKEIERILDFAKSHKNIDQIAFNFHTPFKGSEEMALSQEQRTSVIELLISSKKKGYPIMNTVSGLKNMLNLNFKRYCWICNFVYCDGRQSPICIDNKDSGMCDKCGFSMAGEMNAVFRFKPDTILTGLKSRG
ncbi:MAG: radical SAM protein [Bacteroidales bacterium]|nr:radical SAM protein [Bacteroidales bacterium]